ncbi:hypothetical protein BYT27DRAFT_6743459 [Phlegmacium glaucopus]|nr:hypothetical protein BYT27DRAFT_6743459 [Phlegmacium glaucopus]
MQSLRAMGFAESWFKRTLLFLSLPLSLVGGRFTQPACVFGACVQQDSTGRWCYIPNPGITAAINCTGGTGADSTMIAVMDVHFQQGLSIAYYNGVDNTLLGGADFSVPTSDGIIRLCVSGKAGDGSFQTLCDDVAGDNTLQGAPYCFVALGQAVVSDGCYVPKSGVVVQGGQTSSVSPSSPTIISTDKATTHPTTLVSATIVTIVTNGATQTIIEVPQTQTNTNGSKSYTEKVVVPIVIVFLVVVAFAIGLGVFVWWYKHRMRSRLPGNGPVVPPSVNPNPPEPPGIGVEYEDGASMSQKAFSQGSFHYNENFSRWPVDGRDMDGRSMSPKTLLHMDYNHAVGTVVHNK